MVHVIPKRLSLSLSLTIPQSVQTSAPETAQFFMAPPTPPPPPPPPAAPEDKGPLLASSEADDGDGVRSGRMRKTLLHSAQREGQGRSLPGGAQWWLGESGREFRRRWGDDEEEEEEEEVRLATKRRSLKKQIGSVELVHWL